jgi:Na+/H+ antiporter NhaD/arsenite permease-like protein
MHSYIALGVFVAAYGLFVGLPHQRTLVAMAGSALLLLTGTLSVPQAVAAINWNVMGIFVGTLAVADIFMESRVPAYCAEIIVDRAKNTAWAILLICALSGFISAFVENVATVLIVAPIALALAKKLKIDPTNMMIAIAISSNLQGAATLIGDPPSMLLSGYAKMNFMDFFFYKGKPSIFFAVELGALTSFLVLYYFFRHQREKMSLVPAEKVVSWIPTVILVVTIVALAASSFFDTGFSYAAGIICMIAGFVSLLWARVSHACSVRKGLKKLDWDTTFFLMGVFILVGALTRTGWITVIADKLSGLAQGNLLAAYLVLVVLSVVLSGFIDNVPFLAAMLPVAMTMASTLHVAPQVLLFGLLIGASVGGNLTPIGASANIVACGLLKKEGRPVSFAKFMKIGIPFTAAAVSAASIFIWYIWKN